MAWSEVVILLIAASFATVASQNVCPVNGQKSISTSRELLPLGNIRSTNEDSTFSASLFVSEVQSDAWCSDSSAGSIAGQYLELTFTEPVIIALVMSGGFLSRYVNNFTIHYTLSEDQDDFQVYGVRQPTQDFIVPTLLTSNIHFVLERQITARRVRFIINDGMVNGFVCWKIVIFGCTLEQAQSLGSVPSEPTSDPTSAPGPGSTPTSTPTARPSSGTISVICQDQEMSSNLLVIILPVAIGVFLVIVVIIALLLCICCMRCSHKKKNVYTVKEKIGNDRTRELVENGTTTPSSVSFHYDNPRFLCYDVPRTSMRSRQNSHASLSTVGSHVEVKNPAYATKKSLGLQGYSESPYHLPPPEDNDYEEVPGSPSELDQRTFSNTHSNSNNTAPPICTNPPKIERSMDSGTKSPTSVEMQYSKVNKMRSKSKDEMERDVASPVINSYYVSTDQASLALANEMDRLANDLENSRAIARQW